MRSLLVKKKYSRISRIFKFALFSSQSRLLHWYDFHALLHNGLLSIDVTLLHVTSTTLLHVHYYITNITSINTATKVFINHKTVKPVNYDCDSANLYI